MSSNSYKDFRQTAFNGGIETRQEFLEDNQVLDAANYWYPQGEMIQRPGTYPRLFLDPFIYPYTDVNGIILNGPFFSASFPTGGMFRESSTGTITPVVGGDLGGIGGGEAIILTASVTSPATVSPDKLFTMWLYTTVRNTSLTNYSIQILTERGYITVHHSGTEYFLDNTLVVGGKFENQYFFTSPADSITNLALSGLPGAGSFPLTGNGYVIKIRLAIGAPALTAGVDIDNGAIPFSQPYGYRDGYDPLVRFNGFFRAQYAVGTKYLGVASTGVTTTVQLPSTILATGTPYTSYIETDRLYLESYFQPPQTSSIPTSPQNTNYSFNFTNQFSGYPPTLAVIPEFNTAFIAFNHVVTEHPYYGPYGTTTANPYFNGAASYNAGPSRGATYQQVKRAQVNTDPNIVGSLSVSNPSVPYPADQIPQLTGFPAANLIVYFKNQLWVAGIEGNPTLVRWSGSANEGAYNVWPEDNQVTLSTAQDNSEITGMAPLGDNLIIFKKNSIWALVDNGLSDNELPLYEPRLVVAGVGTLSHQSIQPMLGGLMFLAEDGFYFFDGTPNIKRLSDPVKSYVDQINPARTPFAVATIWRTKQAYICACSSNGEDQFNDLVFCYDYQNGGWYVWSGWDVQCWLQVDGVGLQEEVWFTDILGRAHQLDKWTQSDNGAYIDSWLLTGRMGRNDVETKTSRELRVWGINNNPEVTYSVIGDDIEINVEDSSVVNPVTMSITMPREEEQRWDSPADLPVSGVDSWVPPRRRERHSPNRTTAQWFQVKIYKMLKVFGIDLGLYDDGRR